MEHFDSYAATFDIPRRTQRATRVAQEIRTALPSGQAGHALEFGCGTGLIGMELLDCFSSLLFMDSSPKMLEKVEEKIASLQAGTCKVMLHDLSLAAPDALRVDTLFTVLTLHHITDTKRLLRNFHSTLSANGLLLIIDLNTDEGGGFRKAYPDFDGHNGHDQQELAEMVNETGFENVQSHTFFHDVKEWEGKGYPYSLFLLSARKKG